MRSYPTQALRNVILLSHSGDGKTTLTEMLLYRTRAIKRLGRVEEGTTTSDYEPEEARRGGSVNLALVPLEWRDHKINLLDPPGYLDFLGEVLSGLRVADAAVVLVDASIGPQVGTDMMWRRAAAMNLPRMVFISKMDRENADFAKALASVQARLGKSCVPLHMPIGAQKEFRGIVDLLSRRAFLTEGVTGEVPQDLQPAVEELREKLVEAIAETDDELATKYLEGGELTLEELGTTLKAAVREAKLFPVLAASGLVGHGIEAVLDAWVDLLPSPAEVASVTATRANGGPAELAQKPEGPLAVLVFKTTADPFVGKLSFFRVYSGTLQSNSQVWNAQRAHAERLAQLFVPRGKTQENIDALQAGDIGAVAKLSATGTGDTLTTHDAAGVMLPGLTFPEPIYGLAVHPKTKADLDKMGSALTRLLEEDPSLQMTREGDTGEIVLHGLGDSHLDVAVQKLHRKFGVDVEMGTPKVPYKETIRMTTNAEYKHKKQTGGHGQYGHVFLALEPLPRGSGFEFAEKVVGGAVPKNYVPAVEKGVREALPDGVLAHYPIVDLRVTLYDGSYHPVDSSEMAFKIAATMALKKGMQQGQPALLEPIMELEIIAPEGFTGDVIGQLNSKRARVHGMNTEGGVTTVRAEAPLAEVLRYATELRSMTQGRGTYSMRYLRYDEVPAHMVQRIIEESNKERAAARA
ncbi:MAG: elongation factor G [Chloroflexi bacterium]|nr:elongation factor G [Chloroflexota bacterium]